MSTFTHGSAGGGSAGERPNFRSVALAVLLVYCVGWVLLMGGGFLAGFLDVIRSSGSGMGDPFANASFSPIAVAVMLLGILCMLASWILFAALLHGMWGVVQDGRASMSPLAGALLAVIPLVNLVGIFFGFSGLAKEINRVGAPMNQGRPLVNAGLALASCICYVVGAVGGCVPFLGCFLSIAGLVGIVMRYISMFGMARACEWIVLSGGAAPMAPAAGGFVAPPIDRGNAFDPPGIG